MIRKRSINLIPGKKHAAPLTLRLNRIAIRLAAGSLILFCLAAGFSIAYIRIRYNQFNALKRDVQELEQGITEKKSVEGLATIASEKLAVLERLTRITRNYSRLLTETLGLQTPDVRISSVSVGKDRTMSLALAAGSSRALETFIEALILDELSGQFTDITATGILRDRSGAYTLSVNMRPDAALFQQAGVQAQ